jgi:signal transduction histidine kinase
VDKLTVAVEDDGGGAAASESIMDATASRASSLSTGNGLAGLRERIAIAGGDFVAAPTDAGGFRVAARLPLSGLPIGAVGSATPPAGQVALPSTDGRHPAGTPLAWIDP